MHSDQPDTSTLSNVTPSDALTCFHAVLASSRSGDGRRGFSDKAFDDLDWPIFCRALSERCLGRDAEELALDLGLLPTPEIGQRRRMEIDEATAAVARDVMPPLRGFDALGDALLRARKSDVLPPDDLLRVGRSARAALRVGAWSKNGPGVDLVREHGARLADVREVAEEVDRCIDATGNVADSASPELGQLRRRVSRLREGILARLDRIVKSPRYDGILQDDYVTIRDERYVLPVRSGEKGDFPGIVHGQSGSGQTLFIEPQELIASNNELRMAQLDVENEVRRILTRLTDLVRRRADHLEANQDILVYLDLTFAAGRLCDELGCVLPEMVAGDARRFDLRGAGHPVLLLRELAGELRVVRNDIRLDGQSALVVSGPNTGGKTVTLKTVGLCALMTRAGFTIPVGPGSSVPWFDIVFSDIGDEQGVDRDLSTFSGHVANIAGFLDDCRPGALVLLDELFAGTDPEQGAALGRALLEELARRGATVVVTTHLEALKTMGMEDDRFAVASVAFDVEKLRPTYRLRSGVPGSSYALRIASRLGLDESVIRAAELGLEGGAGVDRERIIERLEAEHARLARLADEAEAAAAAARAEEQAAREKRKKLAERAEQALDADTRALRDEVRGLRKLARTWSKRLRNLETPESRADAEALRKAVEEARGVANRADGVGRDTPGAMDPRTPDERPTALAVGDSVWVTTFKRNGEVLELDEGAGRAVVRIGPLKTNVGVGDLRVATSDAGVEVMEPTVRVDVSRTDDNTVDLRGERVDEALERLEAFLDRAARNGGRALFVVHGHGTGALKRAVRRELDAAPYALTWRPGGNGEGGDGVTVVEFPA